MAFEALTIDLNARLAKFETELRKVGTSVDRHARAQERSFKSAADGIERHIARMGAALGGALSVGLFVRMIDGAIEAQDEMGKLAEKVGVPVEQLSALKFAAGQSGLELEGLGDGLRKLNVNLAETQAGTGEAREAFRALGINVEQSRGVLKGTDQVLLELAEKFAEMEDGAGKTALAVRIFGRAGADLIPFLNQGRTGIAALMEEAKRLGVVMSGDAVRAATEFNDNLDRIRATSEGLARQIANKLLPTLNELAEEFLDGMRIAGSFGQALRLGLDVNPFKTSAENIRTLTDEIEKLKAAADRPGAGLAQVLDARDRVPQLERALKFAIAQEERRLRLATQAAGISDLDPFGAPPGRPRGKAPVVGDSAKKLQDMFEQRRQQLEQELQRTQQLTTVEELLADLQTERYARVTPAQRDALIALAAQVDLTREDVQVQKEAQEAFERAAAAREEALARQNERLEAAAERWRSLLDPTEEYRRKIAEIAELVNRGKLTPEEGQIALESEAAKILGQMQILGEQTEKTNDIARELGLTFSSAFEDAVIKGEKFSDVLRGVEQDLLRLGTRKLVTEPLFAEFDKLLKGFGGGGGADFIGSLLSGVGGLFGFQHGGSFTVGGAGGPDSKIVAFRATPGEQVTVSPPGQGDGGITVNNHFVITGPVDRRAQQQVAADVGRAVARATRRNG